MNIVETFPAELIRARKESGLDQHQAAEAAGCTQPMWSRYERGGALPTIERLRGIICALPLFDVQAALDVRWEPEA